MGVIPIPAAARTRPARVRESWVKTPSGPSKVAQVPGRSRPTALEPRPDGFTVMRTSLPCGARDSE